jgi:diadenosine tetraphosphate (Ap4A) HIT family hydrolase
MTISGFILDPAFSAGSILLGELDLCEARLQDDTRYPWIVLIPRLPGLREIEDLDSARRALLMEEAVLAGAAVRAVGKACGLAVEKLNLGALGNVTAQLHLHMVGRRAGDPAWPGPVWGQGAPAPYGPKPRAAAVGAALKALGLRVV